MFIGVGEIVWGINWGCCIMLLKAVFVLAVGVGLAIIWESPTARLQLKEEVNCLLNYINEQCRGYESWQIISLTMGVTILLYQMIQTVFYGREPFYKRCKLWVFKQFRNFPLVKSQINKEMAKTRKEIEKELLKTPGCVVRQHLPETGFTRDELIKEMDDADALGKYDWRGGKVSGCAYNCSDEITKIANEVYARYCWTNPLHPSVFPEIRKMESEVVSWCVNLFNGGPDACGTMTSGGTESILMAMRAYRQLAYSRGIEYPEIIGSTATHAAFIKAADYFCMKFVPVPCDHLTRQVNLKKMKAAINSNTIVLVGNAPQYPYGIIDPIQDIAKMALRYNLGVHVDCCLGGFILPFMDKAGYPIEPFDFRVKGVTSISADTHKYGYTPKGSSVIMYSNAELRKRQFFVATDSEIGLYPSGTMAGSRAGGIVAATWATMMFMGLDGYVESTRKVVETTRWLAKEIDQIPGLYVVGTPLCCAVGFASKELNMYLVNNAMSKRGWELNALQFPTGLHISVTMIHTREGVARAIIAAIREAVDEVRAAGAKGDKLSGAAAFYGTSQMIPDRSIVADATSVFLEVCYMTKPSED